MSIGLTALLDDIAGLAKVAAASVDDIAGYAGKAGAKSAGVVIDDAAVTPRYVVGFDADRELPIVGRIALGSLRNKLLFLLPVAVALGAFAPFAITPLLMLGGLYLCYEGAEKIWELLSPEQAHAHEAKVVVTPADPKALEDAKVAGAIRTDFILSAEIMAIALATVPEAGVVAQLLTLALVAIVITVGVYGAVALIVRADDAGLALARRESAIARGLGRGIVRIMPGFLSALTGVGTAAMIWVGGGILIHGLETFGVLGPAHLMHALSAAAGAAAPMASGAVAWLAGALGAGIAGLVAGAMLIPIVSAVLVPAWKTLSGLGR